MEEFIKKGLTNLNKDFSHITVKSRQPNVTPDLFLYSNLFPNFGIPSYFVFPLKFGVPLKFLDFLKDKLKMTMVWEELDFDLKLFKYPFIKRAVFVDKNGFMIMVFVSRLCDYNKKALKESIEFFKKLGLLDKNSLKKEKPCYFYISYIEILTPSPVFRDENKFKEIIDNLVSYIKEHDIKKKQKNVSKIHILIKDDFDMYFKDFNISKSTPELIEPDLFYGDGFKEFNKNLLKRIEDERKGIVLLHGYPGTGKTHYIRYLLKELSNLNKRVVYIPASIVESMIEPSTISFLTNEILENEEDTILLIEDAEVLLESREQGDNFRTMGISNLLNSTDGILNDILGLIVILTFNTDIRKIDKALLRPGRLLARKEFKKIEPKNIEKVAKILNVPLDKIEKNKEYSVAELLNLKSEYSVLLHGSEKQEKRRIGF